MAQTYQRVEERWRVRENDPIAIARAVSRLLELGNQHYRLYEIVLVYERPVRLAAPRRTISPPPSREGDV